MKIRCELICRVSYMTHDSEFTKPFLVQKEMPYESVGKYLMPLEIKDKKCDIDFKLVIKNVNVNYDHILMETEWFEPEKSDLTRIRSIEYCGIKFLYNESTHKITIDSNTIDI